MHYRGLRFLTEFERIDSFFAMNCTPEQKLAADKDNAFCVEEVTGAVRVVVSTEDAGRRNTVKTQL
jgi:hypothetical protein